MGWGFLTFPTYSSYNSENAGQFAAQKGLADILNVSENGKFPS